jgi:transposase, IS30 family
MKQEGLEHVSHETVYQMIYANHQRLGEYRQYLRQGQKKRRRRKGISHKRGGSIPGRVGIEHRPAVAALKSEIGYWESDTVIGANHTGIIVTHVDKALKCLLVGLAKNKSVQQINQVTIRLFEPVGDTFSEDLGNRVKFLLRLSFRSITGSSPKPIWGRLFKRCVSQLG